MNPPPKFSRIANPLEDPCSSPDSIEFRVIPDVSRSQSSLVRVADRIVSGHPEQPNGIPRSAIAAATNAAVLRGTAEMIRSTFMEPDGIWRPLCKGKAYSSSIGP